jgi:hypothetical protein
VTLPKSVKESMLRVISDCDDIALALFEYEVILNALNDFDESSIPEFYLSRDFRNKWLNSIGIDPDRKTSRPWYASSTYD